MTSPGGGGEAGGAALAMGVAKIPILLWIEAPRGRYWGLLPGALHLRLRFVPSSWLRSRKTDDTDLILPVSVAGGSSSLRENYGPPSRLTPNTN